MSVGRPVLVDLPTDLVAEIRRAAPGAGIRMMESVKPAFGSVSLGTGFTLCRPPLPEDDNVSQSALAIWVFDQLTMNPDRNLRKPNCMINGNKLAAIDHEKALVTFGVGGFVPAPWDEKWQPEFQHLFHEHVMSGKGSLELTKQSWSSLNGSIVDELLGAVPASWQAGESVQEMRRYMSALFENLDAAFKNLAGVLP
jgi:hypothetical protein